MSRSKIIDRPPGQEWIDQVTLGSLVIPQQSIGVASRVSTVIADRQIN